MNKIPTLQEYYDMLENHDWYYDFSDSYQEWSKGKTSRDRLVCLANKEPLYPKALELFYAYERHMFSGSPWNTEKAPKPERPSE